MSYFHISAAKNVVTVSDTKGQVAVERKAEDIPASILLHITKALGTVNLSKPVWTKIPFEVEAASDFNLWFVWELEGDRRSVTQEEIVDFGDYEEDFYFGNSHVDPFDRIYG